MKKIKKTQLNCNAAASDISTDIEKYIYNTIAEQTRLDFDRTFCTLDVEVLPKAENLYVAIVELDPHLNIFGLMTNTYTRKKLIDTSNADIQLKNCDSLINLIMLDYLYNLRDVMEARINWKLHKNYYGDTGVEVQVERPLSEYKPYTATIQTLSIIDPETKVRKNGLTTQIAFDPTSDSIEDGIYQFLDYIDRAFKRAGRSDID